MTIFWNGIGIVCCGLAAVLILREIRKDYVPYIILTVSILVFFVIFPPIKESVDWLDSLTMEKNYASVLLKAAGISMLTEAGHEICKSCGETNLSGYICVLGKTEILLMTVPVFKNLLEMMIGYVG